MSLFWNLIYSFLDVVKNILIPQYANCIEGFNFLVCLGPFLWLLLLKLLVLYSGGIVFTYQMIACVL